VGALRFICRGELRELTFTLRSFAAEAYLASVGSLAESPAYIYALKYLPVSVGSLYAYASPVIAVLLGRLLLAEPFGARLVVATAAYFWELRWCRAAKDEVDGRTRSEISSADSGTGPYRR